MSAQGRICPLEGGPGAVPGPFPRERAEFQVTGGRFYALRPGQDCQGPFPSASRDTIWPEPTEADFQFGRDCWAFWSTAGSW